MVANDSLFARFFVQDCWQGKQIDPSKHSSDCELFSQIYVTYPHATHWNAMKITCFKLVPEEQDITTVTRHWLQRNFDRAGAKSAGRI